MKEYLLSLFLIFFFFQIKAQHFSREITELIGSKDTCVTIKDIDVYVRFNKKEGLLRIVYNNKTNIHKVSSFKKTKKNTYIIKYNNIKYILSKKHFIIITDVNINGQTLKKIKKTFNKGNY